MLATFDVELPEDLTPLCGDGSIDEFTLMPVHDALESLCTRLPLWKPNSALVMLDFAIRHGLVRADDDGYVELAHRLRGGLGVDELAAWG